MNKRINQISFGDLFSTSTISQASYENNRLKKHPSDLCLESSSQGVSLPHMSSYSQQMDTFDSQNSQLMSSQQLAGSSQKAARKSLSDDGNREHYKGYSSFNSAVQQSSSLKTFGQPQQQLSLCRARIEEVEERESMDVILSQMKIYSNEIQQVRIDFHDNLERANVLSTNMISKYSENVKTILDNQFSELSILLKTPSKPDDGKDVKLFAKFDELKNLLERQSSSLGKLTKTVENHHKQTTSSFKSMKKDVDDSLCQYAAELTGILRTFIARIEEKLTTKADDIINCLCDKWSSNVSSQNRSVSDMEVQVDSMASRTGSNADNQNVMLDKMDLDGADAETVPGSPPQDPPSLYLTPNKFSTGSNNQPMMMPYDDSAFYSDVVSTNVVQDHECDCPVINLSLKNERSSNNGHQIGIASFSTSSATSDVQAVTPLDLSMQKLSLDGHSDTLTKSKSYGGGLKSPAAYNRSDISAQIDYYCSGENQDEHSDDSRSSRAASECRDELSCLVDANVFLSVNNVCKENHLSVRGASSYKTVKKTVVCWENSSKHNQGVSGRQACHQLSPRTPVYSSENTTVHFDGPQHPNRGSRLPQPSSSIERRPSFQGQAASDSKAIPNQPCQVTGNSFSTVHLKRPALARIENQLSTVSRSTESFQRRRSGGKTNRRSRVVCQRIGKKRKSTFRSDPSFRYDDDYEDSDKENVDPKFLAKYPPELNFPRRSKRKIEVVSTAEDEFSWTSTSTKSSSEAN